MNDKTNVPAAMPKGGAVQVRDNGLRQGSLIEQSLAGLTPEQAQTLLLKAAEERLKLEVLAKQQSLDFAAGQRAIDSHTETFNSLEKQGRLTRQVVVSDVKTGAGQMRIESKSGATCFVASVAYRDPNHVDVIFLRQFRDEQLSRSVWGEAFIRWYWINGPKIARFVDRADWRKTLSKSAIRVLVMGLRLLPNG
jgi:hypothetical protein